MSSWGGGSGAQASNAKLWNIFLKFFYSAVDLQTSFNICSQCQGRTNGDVTLFLIEIMAANQPNFIFPSETENLCHFTVSFREEVLSRNDATRQRILRNFGLLLEISIARRSFIGWHYDFLKYFCSVHHIISYHINNLFIVGKRICDSKITSN